MESNKRQGRSFSVDIPKGQADDPSWVRIGAIAVVGFVVGVAWPKLAGVRVGPSAPAEAVAARAAAQNPQAAAAPETSAAPAAAQAPSAAVNAPGPNANPNAPEIVVKNGILLGCKTEDGQNLRGLACGTISFDGIAQPHIKKLAQCAAAQGAEGKFGVVFNLDFSSKKTRFSVGHSSTVKDAEGLVSCLKTEFESVSLSAVTHEHPTYSILYNTTFLPHGTSSAEKTSRAEPTPSGNGDAARIVWEVAIVRDKPRTGQVVARLSRGANVHVGTGQDGWYQVKYGDSFASEGWLYRGAIGK